MVGSIMPDFTKFTLLRNLLKTLGLSPTAIEEIIQFIQDLLGGHEADPAETQEGPLPYHLRDDFLSPAERSFYLVLRQAVGDWALVCPKVSLGDLFYAKTGDRGENQAFTNRISRKHVDFLLCDPATVQPRLGLELDDRSHQRPDRQERDRLVERVFAAAGLPLARLPVQHAYNTAELAQSLRRQAHHQDPAPATSALGSPDPATPSATPPACPKCGSPMVLRTAKKGANQGQQFWGCPNYPGCRAIINL